MEMEMAAFFIDDTLFYLLPLLTRWSPSVSGMKKNKTELGH